MNYYLSLNTKVSKNSMFSVPYRPIIQRAIMTLCLNFLGVNLQWYGFAASILEGHKKT